ncbi:MAG: iron ABC transporter permease [Pseudomonadota bacterium]
MRSPSLRGPSLLIALVALVVSVAAAAAIGAVHIPLWSSVFGSEELTALHKAVLWELRLPRVVLAAVVGVGLAMSGAVLQGLFRNPLAEPQLIGVSSGAALGAIAMIVLGDGLAIPDALLPYAVPLAAIAGALVVTTALYLIARRIATEGVAIMLLVGIAINALAAVGIGLFTWIANDGELRSLTFWTLGSFGGAEWATVVPVLLIVLLSVALLFPLSRDLDALQLGEVEARHLGVSVPRLRKLVVFCAASAVGAGVAVSGMIGFVGLVVPHIARMVGGVHHRMLLPLSALMGASLMVLADLGARTFVTPAEMPVGLLTSAIGAPFFLWLIVRRDRGA